MTEKQFETKEWLRKADPDLSDKCLGTVNDWLYGDGSLADAATAMQLFERWKYLFCQPREARDLGKTQLEFIKKAMGQMDEGEGWKQ